MGSFFRSEEMNLCQLFIQPEAAYSSVAELGEAGSVQFRDLNSEVNAFQRKFVSEVRRCDELERKLRYIEAEVNKDSVPIPDLEVMPNAPNPREITDLETSLEKTENEILELSQNAVNLKSNFLELTELRHVLEKTEQFFAEQEGVNGTDSLTRALISEDPISQQTTNVRGRLGFVAGVVPRERVPAFERMLWRISRGNVFLRQAEIEHSLEDPNTVLNQTQDHRHRVLVSVAKELQNWMIMVRKMKAIYHTLNMFNMDVTKKCLIAECWVPVRDLPGVRKALADGGSDVKLSPLSTLAFLAVDVIRFGASCAPNVLILFINMMLFKSNPATAPGCQEFMFEGQDLVQKVFVIIAVLCIPTLLLGKPLYLLCCKKSKKSHHVSRNGDVNQGLELTPETVESASPAPDHNEEEEEEGMGEIFIHQGIHTIEYILSTISHTASYLRLWALSLAHARKLVLTFTLWLKVSYLNLVSIKPVLIKPR
ncbi:hypothetical protein C0J52_26601 [Blattella germanica]|nr:hypothetical protein C0J52_26601 [Blattella germanica]